MRSRVNNVYNNYIGFGISGAAGLVSLFMFHCNKNSQIDWKLADLYSEIR